MAPAVNRSPDMAVKHTNNLTSDLNLLSSLSSRLSCLEIFLSKTLNLINNVQHSTSREPPGHHWEQLKQFQYFLLLLLHYFAYFAGFDIHIHSITEYPRL